MTTLTESQRRQSALVYGSTEQPLDWACGPRIDAATVKQLYRNNLRGGVAQHLRVNFPTTYRYLGRRVYRSVCDRYLDASPPRHPVFTVYAAHFPAFLSQQVQAKDNTPGPGRLDEIKTLGLWRLASALAQIDFFYSNASHAGQRLTVWERHFRLWLAVHAAEESAEGDAGLYQDGRFDAAVTNATGDELVLETRWQDGELVFTDTR